MTVEEALTFLRAHQPMPNEIELRQEEIDKYDAVRRFFVTHPDPRSVPLFLGSFGEGTAYGIYQLVDEVLRVYPREIVVRSLKDSLRSGTPSVRIWSLQMALDYPDEELRPCAAQLQNSEDEDERFWAEEFLKAVDHRN